MSTREKKTGVRLVEASPDDTEACLRKRIQDLNQRSVLHTNLLALANLLAEQRRHDDAVPVLLHLLLVIPARDTHQRAPVWLRLSQALEARNGLRVVGKPLSRAAAHDRERAVHALEEAFNLWPEHDLTRRITLCQDLLIRLSENKAAAAKIIKLRACLKTLQRQQEADALRLFRQGCSPRVT